MTDPAWTRGLSAAALLAAYLAFCAGIAWRERRRRREAEQQAAALAPAAPGQSTWLVAHASQTGFAEQLAWQSARLLHHAGLPVRLLALGELKAADLTGCERALFIVSTYGEGDAPDSAARFQRHLMAGAPDLKHLRPAVLALGDRSYANFCGFGRRLDAWLQVQGAAPLFERIELDNEDPVALQAWQRQLAHAAGIADLPTEPSQALAGWQMPGFEAWRVVERRWLNEGSAAAPVCHLELLPAQGPLPDWQAGDLVQLRAPGDDARPREYTIASVPSAGRLHLMVRQERRADGEVGVASGWLTAGVPLGGTVSMRPRAHASFRIEGNADRRLVLIGNGTGLAGLRAHLMARAAQAFASQSDIAPCWLLYGEREAAHDRHYSDDIDSWLARGVLAHADRVFSRDQAERRYVQHRLRELAPRLQDWVAQGAAIYVCGSLQGMAAGVDAVLSEALGADRLARLADEGRYRRDVY